jgi:hypothetical protein
MPKQETRVNQQLMGNCELKTGCSMGREVKDKM